MKNREESQFLDYEKVRYRRKGYGLITAIIVAISWFTLVPSLIASFWPDKIENEGVFYFFMVILTHHSSFIIINLISYIIYKGEWNFFERYKTNDEPWPWNKDPVQWRIQLKRTFKFLIFNQFILIPLGLLPNLISNISVNRLDSESFPSIHEVVIQTVFFMIVEDFFFYLTHRTFHHPKIYPHFHKIHHEYINTISIVSEYAHPVEFILANMIPSNLGGLILGKRAHAITHMMWIILRIGESTDGHCGYEFSWSPFRLLIFSGSSEFHNFHHLNSKGNYSSFFTIWDRILGTVNPGYLRFIKKKKELLMKSKEN